MSRIFISPSKFVQGSKELLNLGKHISIFGSKALIVASDADLGRTKVRIEESLKDVKVEVIYGGFSEECTKKEIGRLSTLANEKDVDIVIGIGGEKALDTAKAVSDANVVTEALENIIEANILLSGLGFESSGLAAAHAIHNGLTVLEETHKFFHGEKVAFGTTVHLVLENPPKEELETVINYCKAVGLPTNLKALGVEKIDERLMEVARLSTVEGETIHNMPFKVTADDVYAAILAADILGR